MKVKQIIKKILIIVLLFFLYLYILAIQSLPDNIIMIEGEQIGIKTIFGIRANLMENNQIIETISNNQNKTITKTGRKTAQLSLFKNIPLKNVNVDVLPRTKVIPVGSIAGIKLYTSGVLVVGMSEIQGIDNKTHKPYENTGIEEGDTIVSINNNKIQSTEELIEKVNKSNGNELEIQYVHNEKTLECSITPVQTSNTEYKLGLWVRDSAAGVGTVTFYEPETQSFGALGHGITDIDTEQLIDISSGEFVTTKILNVVKGESGNPGKIQGTVDNQKNIGTIYKNTKFGIYGKVENLSSINIDKTKEIELALRNEIKTGKATIMCSLENGKIEEYEIEIEKIYKENNYNNKSMLIKVTDNRLLEKTGGIIQRYEWLTNNTKWKVCGSNYTCTCKQSSRGIWRIWRYYDKTNEICSIKYH